MGMSGIAVKVRDLEELKKQLHSFYYGEPCKYSTYASCLENHEPRVYELYSLWLEKRGWFSRLKNDKLKIDDVEYNIDLIEKLIVETGGYFVHPISKYQVIIDARHKIIFNVVNYFSSSQAEQFKQQLEFRLLLNDIRDKISSISNKVGVFLPVEHIKVIERMTLYRNQD